MGNAKRQTTKRLRLRAASLLAALHSGQRLIQLDDGSTGMLPEQWLNKFGSLATLAESKGDTLRFAPTQALLLATGLLTLFRRRRA